MSEGHDADPRDELPRVFGYVRCHDCGNLVMESLGNQTKGRCIQCWKDRSPLATLEVIQESVRYSARRQKRPSSPRKKARTGEAPAWNARYAAFVRLANLFPDVFDMILDEERAVLGLGPVAHYEPIDVDAVVSKTLAFHDVYDALESEGVSDA